MKNWRESLEWKEGPGAKCPSCDGENVTTSIEEQTFVYGTGDDASELKAHVPVHHCDECDIDFTDGFAETLRHAAICEHLGVMTPDQVSSVRKAYGISRAEFARISRIGEASLTRWENGTLIQNAAYDQFLYLLTYPENLGRLHERAQSAATPRRETVDSTRVRRFPSLAKEGVLERKHREGGRFALRTPA